MLEKEAKKDLETALKEKVEPLLEQTMEKHLGITIPKIEADITDKLKQSQLNIYIPFNSTFSKSKQMFKKEFFKRELQRNQGNISQMAKSLDLDRRSVHRAIKDLKINVAEIRLKPQSLDQFREEFVSQTIRSTLDQYRDILRPEKMEKIYQQVDSLSRNIARIIPEEKLTWRETEQEFEKQFLENCLENNNWN